MMSGYKLFCLGRPFLELDGQPLKLEMRKSLALLVYVRMAAHEPSREALAALFWPEFDQRHAQANLRRVLSSLNSSLGQEFLEVDREKVGLKDRHHTWLDVEAFQQLLVRFKTHAHPVEETCPECLSSLDEAIQLYQGDFMQGFNLGDCPEFDEWQYLQRESLRQEFGWVLANLSAIHAAKSRWEDAISCARRRVALDRLDEPAQRSLIRLYLRVGQRSAALRQYEELANLLSTELGQSPENDTLELMRKIRGSALLSMPGISEPVVHTAEVLHMPGPLLKTKLYIPSLRGEKVDRQRLMHKLNRIGDHALTILSAPAGFGKTTALIQWISQSPLPVGWLSLDNDDNDPARFLSYLIAAIENIQSEINQEIVALFQSPQSLPFQTALTILLHDLERITEPFVIVLDDYQFIEATRVHELVSFVLDHLPASMRLVISTRADPPLGIARLRAKEQLLEIRSDDLRFTPEEASEYLNQAMGLNLTTDDIEILEGRTEGWIVGLQMAAIALQYRISHHGRQDLSQSIQAFSGTNRYILDYLVEEVLRRQPAHVQAFLLRTSFLERMCGSLCDSVTGIRDWDLSNAHSPTTLIPPQTSQQILEYLERANLFLIPLDDERRWYRYHQLFSELLRARLLEQDPALIINLHARAAEWYDANGFAVEAIKHCQASRDQERTSELVSRYAEKLIRDGGFSTVLGWMKNLPPETISRRPWLCIWYAWAVLQSGSVAGVDKLIQDAEHALEKQVDEMPDLNATPIQAIEDQIIALRTTVASLRNDHDHTIKLAIQALAQIQEDKPWQRINILYILGNTYYFLGDLSQAEFYYLQVRRIAEQIKFYTRYFLSIHRLAHIQWVRGELHRAYDLYLEGIRYASEQHRERDLGMGFIYSGFGSILYEWNLLEEAGKWIHEGVNVDELTKVPTMLANSYSIYAHLLITQGRLEAAQEKLKTVGNLVRQYPVSLETASMAEACRVRLWLAMGDRSSALAWVQERQGAGSGAPGFAQIQAELACARVLVAEGHLLEAGRLLARLAGAAEAGGWISSLIHIRVLQALVSQANDDPEQALDYFESSICLAEPHGFVRLYVDEGNPVAALIRLGLKARRWEDPEILVYIEKILRGI